jgi:Ca2+-binding EF-hand superfamily protein
MKNNSFIKSIIRNDKNEKKEELKAAFSFLDIKGDNKITLEELDYFYKNIGLNFTESELIKIINDISFTGEKKDFISFEDFQSLMNNKMNDSETELEIKETFKLFDRENNGYLSISEFEYVMVDFTQILNKEEFNNLIDYMKLKNNDKIFYKEFIEFIGKL